MPANQAGMDQLQTPIALRELVRLEPWIGFDWASYTDGPVVHERAALMVPMIDPGTGNRFHLQLDTAISGNLVYRNVVSGSARWSGTSPQKTGENTYSWVVEFERGTCGKKDIGFTSKCDFDADIDNADRPPVLGSLGLDMLGESGFALDYPAQRIYFLSAATLDRIEARHAKSFHSFSCLHDEHDRQICLPFHLENQEMTALFDTGSSMFELLLPPEAWKTLTQVDFERAEKVISIPAWGKLIDIYGHSCRRKICLGGKEFPIGECYSWPTYRWQPIVGNQPFLDHVLVFDLRNHRYAIF